LVLNPDDFGCSRVLWPKEMLPNSAWQMDVTSGARSTELILSVNKIQLERSSFKQLCHSAFFDTCRVKEEILDIVQSRGKLHNPYTDTGGIFAGTITQIGDEYKGRSQFRVGDALISLTSTTLLPLVLHEIKEIDYSSGQVDVTGKAFLYGECMVTSQKSGLPLDVALAAFEESGSVFHVAKLAELSGSRYLIVGNNVFLMVLYALAIRETKGLNCHIVCIFDDSFNDKGLEVADLLRQVFDECITMQTLHLLRNLDKLEQLSDNSFDLTVNCSDIPGSEFINALVTKPGGTVVFTGMANNYKEAVFITEVLRKELVILNGDGYLAGYVEYMEKLIQRNHQLLRSAIRCTNPAAEMRFQDKTGDMDCHDIQKSNSPAKLLESGFIFHSKKMERVVEELLKAAKYDCSVILSGETGTGKERALDIIYRNSSRSCFPCVKINCAAIPGDLMEAELFGYEKGAFTGASNAGREGLFVAADRGILFLDEIAELAPNMQAKLLRVVQENEFYKVGGNRAIRVNVRIIAATNRDIYKLVCEGGFREDLYYRLNILKIDLPPLRARPEDIIPLANYFIAKYAADFKIERNITREGLLIMQEHAWPGNIRELENFVQRLMINANDSTITSTQVFQAIYRSQQFCPMAGNGIHLQEDSIIPLQKTIECVEGEMIKHALERGGSTRAAAKILGISQTQLQRKKLKLELKTESDNEKM